MKKKINVLTVTLKVHIPIDPGNMASVQNAASGAERLGAIATTMGETIVETRVTRVAAPKPVFEPAPQASEPVPDPTNDGLDIPEPLRRTAETKPTTTE